MVLAKTRKLGGSLIVTLPRALVQQEGLEEGQLVDIEIQRPKQSGFGISKGIAPFTEEDKFRGQLE